jgi:hypothetical protein
MVRMEQERQPAQLDVGADAVFAVAEDRPQPQRPFRSRQPRSAW